MKIDSGLNGYYYQSRTQEIDRKTEEAPTREEASSFSRNADAITGSSTLFSSALSNALWVMESGQSAATADASLAAQAVSQDWVENLYQEFS
jgi:hypothetical protein